MKQSRAIALAIECIRAEIKRLAVDANLHDRFGMDTPHGRNSSARRKQLQEAIATLQQDQQVRLL